MIIWRGHGFLVVLILLLSTFIVEFIYNVFMPDAGMLVRQLAGAFMCFLAAIGVFVYTRLSPRQKTRKYVDSETGDFIVSTSKDSLFFIPVRFWTVIYAVLGIAMLIACFLPT